LTYFKRINNYARLLKERKIDGHNDPKKMRVAVSMMWSSGIFTEDQMVDWEDKAEGDKTWAMAQAYFTTKWQSRQAFTKSTNKKGSPFHNQSLGAISKEEVADGKRHSNATCSHARKSLQPSQPNVQQQHISHGADDKDDDRADERNDHKHEGEHTSSKHKEQRGTRTRWRPGWRTEGTTEEGVPLLQDNGFPQTQQLH
jgi:hypothetical protein